MATSSSSAVGKLSKEEWRRRQDLDAARKAGTAPAEVDEEGKAINPHIPQFMASAPWYMDTGRPSLKHQKAPLYNDDPEKMKERFTRGFQGPQAKKYRKGACTNCGAMTHTAKDCVERPRKAGAKWTNKDISRDELVHDANARLNFQPGRGDWDAKRDRWDGYDPGVEYHKTVEEYEKLDEARRKLREEEIDRGAVPSSEKGLEKVAKAKKGRKKRKRREGEDSDDSFGTDSEEEEGGQEGDDDELKYADEADAAGQRMDTKTRVTVRNLRIREDTAKYLVNLDIDSAYYDPKSRSMREAPDKNVNPEDAVFAGDMFERSSGEAKNVQALQLFAWQSEARGNNVHVNANPTQAQLLHNKFMEKKEELKETGRRSILDKYGGEEYLEKVPKELLAGQREDYVEYSRTGEVVRGLEKVKMRSKYDEDVYHNNHTSVWGSWYSVNASSWGYACCHSTTKNSYCVGRAAIEASEREATDNLRALVEAAKAKKAAEATSEKDEKEKRGKKGKRKASETDLDQEGLSKKKLAKAMKEEKERQKLDVSDERSLKYGGVQESGKGVTEEEMEAYKRMRSNYEDPMANYVDEG
ncbi:hypothetical protein BT69DRAFT_1311224 [Atractiella rhizophila]|nr:hypothetical protein BT69DRAFT_1311224 [Atractiella rhizophila]